MDLSIITITHNSRGRIVEQLNSVLSAAKSISFEQFVVDNDSTDGTPEVVAQKFPQVKLIKNDHNAGFGRANNQAAVLAKGDFFLFLNPDMRLEPESLDKLIAWARQHPETGVIGCKLVNEKGEFNSRTGPRRFPAFFDQLMIFLKLPHLFPGLLKKYMWIGFDSEKEQEVDSVQGAFMLVRRSLYEKLGRAFDPRYFIWFEDVDLCRECWRLGWKVMYTPTISCLDFVGQDFKKKNILWKQLRFFTSMIKYFWKWKGKKKR